MRRLAQLLVFACAATAAQAEPVLVDGGTFATPVLLDERRFIEVPSFRLDPAPVTNGEFGEFVAAYPRWSRAEAPALFRDPNYLATLDGPASHPVTNVSWFAASAYCAARGGRLPTIDEWEYVAAAVSRAAGLEGDAYAESIFGWYADPVASAQRPVRSGPPGLWGVHDMHGLVLEWVEDFQLVIQQTTGTGVLGTSCGDTARFLAENDPAHYATFLRYQSRSNYSPRSATSTLGFRCAYDLEQP